MRSQRMMQFYSTNGLANGTQGGEQVSTALYEDPEDYYDESWKLKMYGGRHIRQTSLSSSYCSSSTSFPSSPSADQLGNSSNTTATTIFDSIKPPQVPSMSNEDMLMIPSSPLQAPTRVNSFNLDMLNQVGLNDGHDGGNAVAAPDVCFQINNTGNSAPSHASHDQSHFSGFSPYISSTSTSLAYISSTNVEVSTAFPKYISSTNVEASATGLPSLSKPVNQHHQLYLYEPYGHNYFPQGANYSSDQVLDAYNSLHSYNASGLGSSHEESIAVLHSQLLEAASLPLITCAETSQSASQNNDQKPQWGNTYSSINGGGRVSTDTLGRSGRAMHDFSEKFSTGPGATLGSLAHHNLGAQDKLGHSSALLGETERRRLMKLKTPVLGANHEPFIHHEIPNRDQGDEIVGLSAGLTTVCPAGGTNYGDRACGSADKADYRMEQHRMEQQEDERSRELIIRASSGLSNMEYGINKARGLQELQETAQGDQNVSSGSTPLQRKAAVDHMHAERNRRHNQGRCYDTLRRLVPHIPGKKKADKIRVLESTIEYIKTLERLVSELQKEKVALGNMNNKDSQGKLESSCYSQQLLNIINPIQNITLETIATCEYIHSPSSREMLPHFQLNIATSAKNVNANVSIIEITRALQKKNLHCIEFKLEVLKSTSNFDATILAIYKDGEKCTPNLDEIEDIKQWWTHLIIDQLSAKWKL